MTIEDKHYSSSGASSSYSSSSSSSSPLMMMMKTAIDERMMQQQQDNDANNALYTLRPLQLHASLYIPRILGIIIVLSSIFMFILAWKRRDRLFHRLVLGTYRNHFYFAFMSFFFFITISVKTVVVELT
jgi:hypothetical protein